MLTVSSAEGVNPHTTTTKKKKVSYERFSSASDGNITVLSFYGV